MDGPQDEGAEAAIITHNTLVISLTPELKEAMQRCLARSGKIELKLEKVEFTTLPGVGTATHAFTD